MVRACPRLTWLAWLMSLSWFAAGCQTTEKERVRDINDDGVFLYSQGDYRGARENFELALTLDPRDPALVFNLGQCYDRLGDSPRAEQYYRHCLELDVKHGDARQSLAVLLDRTGRTADAHRLVDDFAKDHPNDADALALEAWKLRQEKNLPMAQNRLQQALAIDPHNRRALVQLGVIYEASGMPERALALYQRVLERDPRQSDVAQRLGQLKAQGVSKPLPD